MPEPIALPPVSPEPASLIPADPELAPPEPAESPAAPPERARGSLSEQHRQDYELRKAELRSRMTPEDEAMVDSLAERINQGDTNGYFELLELYPQARFRQRVLDIINDPTLSSEDRRPVDWSVLRAADPPRYVRLILIDMIVSSRSGRSRDPRDEWAAIELTAMFAKEHNVDAGPILDEIGTLSGSMSGQIRARRHMFE
ncbi:MAG: hypothetical protein JXQ72_04225 [Anaerolineae bacterium]|nr:hypothetical protein [Anaerolineae bacterium]